MFNRAEKTIESRSIVIIDSGKSDSNMMSNEVRIPEPGYAPSQPERGARTSLATHTVCQQYWRIDLQVR
ncbi:hypothetical protein BH686_16735 [Rhodococcus erythropolis]|nr:hypothetical protein BH686_16735 [Rhodococcus erythropolis]